MSRPVTRSPTASRAVSMSTGAVRPSSRRVLSTLNPSCLGSITSSTTRSHAEPSATRSSASAPSPATSTAWPSSSSPFRMKLATFRSSSTTRMRIRSVVHHPLPPVNAGHVVVLDLGHLFQHFGYAAILVIVLLGNMGFPAPEESVLVLGGSLSWQHRLHLPLVMLVGIVSACLGDNIGYWLGRRYGPRTITKLPLPQASLAQAQSLLSRYGTRAVFISRFVAGLRTVAGPLAGAGGLPPLRFFVANLLGSICYVPWPVLFGFGIGYGFAGWVEKIRAKLGLKQDLALFAAVIVVGALGFAVKAWLRDRRGERPAVL